MCAKEGEGQIRGDEQDIENCKRIEDHIIAHVKNKDWGLVIEMSWEQHKKNGCTSLRLK